MTRVVVIQGDRETRLRLAQELGEEVALFAESEADARAVIREMPGIVAVVIDLDRERDISGLELLRFFHEEAPTCIRVVVTTQRHVVLEREAPRLADAVFGKPWITGTIGAFLRTRTT